MAHFGAEFYDDDAVFSTYARHRQRPDNPNNTLEKPVVFELLGSVVGQRVLDLGCGDALFGRELLAAGARRYVGVEGSRNMVAVAQQNLAGTGGEIIHNALEDWEFPSASFDLVVSRLALHYLADLDTLCAHVYASLVADGRFICSVEHPVITSCDRGWPEGTLRQDWVVDNYFDTGLRVTSWMGGVVQKYHRTVEDYFATFQRAGFIVEQLRESRPQREHFAEQATYERRKRIPLFLFIAGRKADR